MLQVCTRSISILIQILSHGCSFRRVFQMHTYDCVAMIYNNHRLFYSIVSLQTNFQSHRMYCTSHKCQRKFVDNVVGKILSHFDFFFVLKSGGKHMNKLPIDLLISFLIFYSLLSRWCHLIEFICIQRYVKTLNEWRKQFCLIFMLCLSNFRYAFFASGCNYSIASWCY